jgi:hypothetical protein
MPGDDEEVPVVSPVEAPVETPEGGSEYHRPTLRAAHEKLQPAMDALGKGELERLNLDPWSTMIRVVGAWPRIRAMREEIVAELPRFDIARFDTIEERALALGHVHATEQGVEGTNERLLELRAQATRQRDIFRGITRTLLAWGLLRPGVKKLLKAHRGDSRIAFDLVDLAVLFRHEWATIGPRTGLQFHELDEAETLGTQLLEAAGRHQQTLSPAARRVDRRQRAFTLLMQAYNDAISAIRYLRGGQKEANAIIPPLYRGRVRKSQRHAEHPGDDSPQAHDPAVSPAGAPASPAASHEPEVIHQPPPASAVAHDGVHAPASAASHDAAHGAAGPLSTLGPLVPGGPGGSPFLDDLPATAGPHRATESTAPWTQAIRGGGAQLTMDIAHPPPAAAPPQAHGEAARSPRGRGPRAKKHPDRR